MRRRKRDRGGRQGDKRGARGKELKGRGPPDGEEHTSQCLGRWREG